MRLPFQPRQLVSIAVVSAVGIGLALLLFRQGRLLSFDSYYYCELAKLYQHQWPRAFGNHWPCGYPLLGALVALSGLSAYQSLCLISVAAVVLLVAATHCVLDGRRAFFTALTLVAVPELGVQTFGAMTELPFAAALMGLALCLAQWPARGLAGAVFFAVLALCLRYAGVLAFGILWLWLLVQWRPLARAGRLRPALGAAILATALGAALLGWNQVATGHLSGADRTGASDVGLASLLHHAVDLGWSLPSALMLGGARSRFAALGSADTGLGLLLVLAECGLFGWAWWRPREPWARPVALTGLSYLVGMIALRAVGSFDALSHPRTIVPALVPLGLVLVGQWPARGRPFLVAGACLVGILGLRSADQGLSREVAGEVAAAVPILIPRLHGGDRVQINEDAFTLSAYLRGPVDLVRLEALAQTAASARFLVITAKPRDRAGTPYPLEKAWADQCARWVEGGHYHLLLRTASVAVLERDEPARQP